MIWDSFFFTHPTSPAAPTSDKQFSKVFLKVVYLVVETFISKSCVSGKQMPVLIHMRITRCFHKVHSLYKCLKNKKQVWRGGEVADGPQSLHSLRSWYFSLNSCFSSCQSVINWRTSLNKEVCWKKLKLKQNDLSFFSVLYIKSPYSIEMNWQHINKNVYDEKGQGKSIRMTQEKKQ